MVVSARWRAVFDFSEKYIQKTEKVSAVAEKVVLVAGNGLSICQGSFPKLTNPEFQRSLVPSNLPDSAAGLRQLFLGPVRGRGWTCPLACKNSMICRATAIWRSHSRDSPWGSCQQTLKTNNRKIDTEVSKFTDGEILPLDRYKGKSCDFQSPGVVVA